MGVSDSRGKIVKRPMLELELVGAEGNKISWKKSLKYQRGLWTVKMLIFC